MYKPKITSYFGNVKIVEYSDSGISDIYSKVQ